MGCINGVLSVLLFLWIGCHVSPWAFPIVVVVGVLYLGMRLVTDKK